jgi:hypothetical protein
MLDDPMPDVKIWISRSELELETLQVSKFIVQRMLDDPAVAPDAESRRDEEIRGHGISSKPEVP